MLEVQDDSFGVVGFWWELSSCLVHVCLFAEFLTWWEAKEERERERASTRARTQRGEGTFGGSGLERSSVSKTLQVGNYSMGGGTGFV